MNERPRRGRPPRAETQQDPLEAARSEIREELASEKYEPGKLVSKLTTVQNALLSSNLAPDKIYSELITYSQQGQDIAERNQDQNSARVLGNLKTGYESTYKLFEKATQSPQQPSQTAQLPMTNPKR